MKYPLLVGLPIVFALQTNNQFTDAEKKPIPTTYVSCAENNNEPTQIGLQDGPQHGRMRSVIFKNQEYCRAELKDFPFDAHFTVVGATVYFSGANFNEVEKATINSNSLKNIAAKMNRCVPGTIVVFDDVKVKGPDNEIRTIPGATYILY